MKIAKLLVCLGIAASAFAAAAARYNVDFRSPVVVSGTELKAGAYRMEVNGDRALIEGNKQKVECNVKVEEGSDKYSDTTVRYSMVDGKNRISEIRLGGTKTKVVFNN